MILGWKPNWKPKSAAQKAAISFVDEVIRRLPFRVLVIQTDNGAEFQSNFHWHLEEHDIRHVYIRPQTPRLNGKVERSHRIDEQEFYQLLDKDGIGDDVHLFNDRLREWKDYYNYHRPHGALDGQTSLRAALGKEDLGQRVTEVLRPYSSSLVARGGIELPTRGFSIFRRLRPTTPTVTKRNYFPNTRCE
jgi:transposase InsO family protein